MTTASRHHVLMALAHTLSNGRPAALLVKRNGNAMPTMFLSMDMHHAYPGHTAVVNVIQHVYKEGWAYLQNAEIYLTAEPSDADYGIFIEQIKQQGKAGEPRLFFTRGDDRICECRPSKLTADPRNIKSILPDVRQNTGAMLPSLNALWNSLGHAGPKTIQYLGHTFTAADADAALIKTLLTTPAATTRAVLRRFGIVPYANDGTAPPFDQAEYPDAGNGVTFNHLTQKEQYIFDSLFLLVCYALAAPSPPVKGKHGETAKVGALMVSPRGGILSWGADFSATFHAEVSAVKLYQDGGLNMPPPPDTRFYTSLEPCFMCSGLLNTAYSLIPHFAVRYGQIDPAVRQMAKTFLKNSYIDERKATTRYDIDSAKGLFADRLDLKGTQELGTFDSGRFKKSVMQQLDVPSFRRRYAKAALDLLAMPYVIMHIPDTQGHRAFLLHAWKNAMAVLSRAKGSSVDPLMRRMGHYLDQTRGQNPIKAQDQAYQAKHAGDAPDKYRSMADTFLRAFWAQ
ncbi:cytidine/deoxycytidylate deaminase family protein [Novispirillum itersonii]|uniref:hypothetical protein n=1 Tax=Novispirillum itersonii TaxID=189 RepID=UPI00036A311F|nr:hypothetical protein [Novispirillum itersonii]